MAEILRSLEDIAATGPVNVVALLLHGALVVDGVATPETDLARKVRAIVGPHVPFNAIASEIYARASTGRARHSC